MRAEDAEGIRIAPGQQGIDARVEVVQNHRFWRSRGNFGHAAILAEESRRANWRTMASCQSATLYRSCLRGSGTSPNQVSNGGCRAAERRIKSGSNGQVRNVWSF